VAPWRSLLVPLAGGLLLGGCGEPAVIDQATTQTPVAVASPAVTQTGDRDVTVEQGSVAVRLDAARLLVISLRLRSAAPDVRTVTLRATVYDQTGRIVGDASGGVVRVAAGAETGVELSGPTPSGTISAITLEVHTVPAPTPSPSP
jgi:hypothetical protein